MQRTGSEQAITTQMRMGVKDIQPGEVFNAEFAFPARVVDFRSVKLGYFPFLVQEELGIHMSPYTLKFR